MCVCVCLSAADCAAERLLVRQCVRLSRLCAADEREERDGGHRQTNKHTHSTWYSSYPKKCLASASIYTYKNVFLKILDIAAYHVQTVQSQSVFPHDANSCAHSTKLEQDFTTLRTRQRDDGQIISLVAIAFSKSADEIVYFQ